MNIWVDLANSPQVLFFRPILVELRRLGHDVCVTSRAYAQTLQLADQLGIAHHPVGRHGGRGLAGLARETVLRSVALLRWARPQRFDLAVSHNSYSQVLAARLLGVPSVTLMDYEHQPLNHLCFRLAQRVIVPEVFPAEFLRKYGASRKSDTYPGLKEQVYLADFRPEPEYLERAGLPTDRPLIVVRPPAPWTAYHRFENDLFDELLAYLNRLERAHVLFVPRIADQARSVVALGRISVAQKVYEGPQLLYHARSVVSGGGTMNREAAVLGTATFTVFRGKLGAVDRHLIALGRMRQLAGTADFDSIEDGRVRPRLAQLPGDTLVGVLAQTILEPVGRAARP